MPHLNGWQLIRELQLLNAKHPVLLCTGYSEQIDSDLANCAGKAMSK